MKGSRQQFDKKLRQIISRLKIEIIDVSADIRRGNMPISIDPSRGKGPQYPLTMSGLLHAAWKWEEHF